MPAADVTVRKALRFLVGVLQNAPAGFAQREVSRGGDSLTLGNSRFDALPKGLECRLRARDPVQKRLVLAQQPQQQMLRFDTAASGYARFEAGKKDHPARLFGVPF